jgi:hypothetical protein
MLHMTNDDVPLFKTQSSAGSPCRWYEGKMIHQFEFARQAYNYWVQEAEGRQSLWAAAQRYRPRSLSYQRYRFAHRSNCPLYR